MTHINKEKNRLMPVHHHVVIKYDGDYKSFAHARREIGLTKLELATLLHIKNADVIENIESGIYGVEDRTYSLFALVTNTHPRYVLNGKTAGGELGIYPPNGDKIREIRRSKNNMTQRKMARLLGLSGHNSISKYENHAREPSIANWTLFLLIIGEHSHYEINLKATEGN